MPTNNFWARVGLVSLVVLVETIFEIILLYFMRKKGPLGFKFKLHPEIDL